MDWNNNDNTGSGRPRLWDDDDESATMLVSRCCWECIVRHIIIIFCCRCRRVDTTDDSADAARRICRSLDTIAEEPFLVFVFDICIYIVDGIGIPVMWTNKMCGGGCDSCSKSVPLDVIQTTSTHGTNNEKTNKKQRQNVRLLSLGLRHIYLSHE